MGLGKSKIANSTGGFQPFLNHLIALNALGLGYCARNFGYGSLLNNTCAPRSPILNCILQKN